MSIVAYRGGMAKGDPVEVFTITDAQRALSVEQTGRTRRYLISMGIRTACVLGAIVVPGWPRWFLIAGAVLIAAYLITSLPLYYVRWLVVAVVVYTSISMLRTAAAERAAATRTASEMA